MKKRITIIGGGAAGIFAAAVCAELMPNAAITVLEKTRQLLAKVRISGGGRCNVTHHQFDPKKLAQHYPRGHKELLGPFHRFQPQDTIAWFERRGVALKTEEDGRMFPTTDTSATIIHCLLEAAESASIRTGSGVLSIEKHKDHFTLQLDDGTSHDSDFVILATGSNPQGHRLAASLGHTLTPPVPSLFTFNVPSSPLLDLSGIAVPDAELSIEGTPFKQRGPLLLTHWGFSGPAALKLSAWAARALHACSYQARLLINWVPSIDNPAEALIKDKQTDNPFRLPANLWKRLSPKPLNRLSHPDLQALGRKLAADPYLVEGKTTYKQEFVTAGGICLKEVDFKTLESKLVPGLFFAGEVLDIDGVTGGFNFQNAWTTAYLAATCISDSK